MSATSAMEYLETPRADRRRPTVALTLAAVVLLVAGLAFARWSQSVGQDANAALSEAVAQSSALVDSGEGVVMGTLAYASPMIWSSAVPDDVRRDLRALVQDSAITVADDLREVRGSAASVRVLPWQSGQAAARDEVLALVDAQISRFERIGADATAIGEVLGEDRPSTSAAVESLRASGANGAPLR